MTLKKAEEFAAQNGATLTRETEQIYRNNGRRTNTYTTMKYKLSSCPDKEFRTINEALKFLGRV